MNTMQLECFLAVAGNLNFARAAEQLNITQPAVTHQINSLENELGVKLFRRTTRSVEFTPAGWDFLDDAKNILNLTRVASEKVRHSAAHQMIPFRIGCPTPLSMRLATLALARIIREYPALHPNIRSIPFPAMSNQLREETLDVLFGYAEINEDRRPGHYVELTRLPILILLPEDHPLADAESISPEDLDGNKMVFCESYQNFYHLAEIQSDYIRKRPPQDLLTCDRPDSALALVRAGFGFAVIADEYGPEELASGVRIVPPAGHPEVSFGVYYKSLKGSPVRRRFIEGLLSDGVR